MTQHENSVLDLILAEVRIVKEILTGNGNPQKGMIVRMDRLEGKAKRATWLICTLASAFALAAMEYVFKLL